MDEVNQRVRGCEQAVEEGVRGCKKPRTGRSDDGTKGDLVRTDTNEAAQMCPGSGVANGPKTNPGHAKTPGKQLRVRGVRGWGWFQDYRE